MKAGPTDSMNELGRAQHCLVHGDLRGAIQIYKVLLESDPYDMRMQERFAALLREDGQLDAARILYRMIARHWEDTGFHLRAVTSYRILVELEPSDLNAKRHLAELYASLHLFDRAIGLYQRLADTFAVQNNPTRRLAMLERMVELAPNDVEARLLFATELDEHGNASEANAQLVLLLDTLFKNNEWKRYATIARRYLERVPEDVTRREGLRIAEERLRDNAVSGISQRPSGIHPKVRSGDVAAVPPRAARSRTVAPALEKRLESIFDRAVPDSLFGDTESSDAENERSEASMLIQLASMDASSRHPSVPPVPLPEPGELGAFAARPFGPSSEVLLKEPGHVVAAALRARKRGDAVLALALLGDEGAAEHPLAAAFERGVAYAARQQWGAAMSELSELMDADVAPADLALIAYNLGVVAEMTHDPMLAQVCFERVESLCPGEAADIPGRLARVF